MNDAATRAEARLLGSLNDVQREQYLAERRFIVISNLGHRWVVDCTRQAANVRRVYRTGWTRGYCAMTTGVPDSDQYLAEALMIRTDERQFRRVAYTNLLALLPFTPGPGGDGWY